MPLLLKNSDAAMDALKKKKIVQSVAGIIVAIAMFFSSGIKIPVLDKQADAYFREAITKAGLAYATCRAINASVSIVKDSSLQLEPAGVGVSLAVGQALDPIDDMTERLSDVLVTAITSLGVQKLAYEMGVSIVPPVLSLFLVFLSILIWFEKESLKALQKTVVKSLLFIAIFRFCLPISSLANEFVHSHFFDAQISEAKEQLAMGVGEIEKLKEISLPQIDGVLGTIENSTSFIKQKSIQLKNAIAITIKDMGSIIESLLALTFLYAGVCLIQIIILPLLSFWALYKMADSLFGLRYDSA